MWTGFVLALLPAFMGTSTLFVGGGVAPAWAEVLQRVFQVGMTVTLTPALFAMVVGLANAGLRRGFNTKPSCVGRQHRQQRAAQARVTTDRAFAERLGDVEVAGDKCVPQGAHSGAAPQAPRRAARPPPARRRQRRYG